MPHCFIEAFAAGLPVVTTPAWAIPYIGQYGVNGLHVPIDEPPSMATAVVRLLGDPTLADRLTTSGRRAMEHRYCWNAAKVRWSELYQRLVGPQLRNGKAS